MLQKIADIWVLLNELRCFWTDFSNLSVSWQLACDRWSWVIRSLWLKLEHCTWSISWSGVSVSFGIVTKYYENLILLYCLFQTWSTAGHCESGHQSVALKVAPCVCIYWPSLGTFFPCDSMGIPTLNFSVALLQE